jgi:agmatine/peptidylarginine deiminase
MAHAPTDLALCRAPVPEVTPKAIRILCDHLVRNGDENVTIEHRSLAKAALQYTRHLERELSMQLCVSLAVAAFIHLQKGLEKVHRWCWRVYQPTRFLQEGTVWCEMATDRTIEQEKRADTIHTQLAAMTAENGVTGGV